jgi:hypothetical protein
MPFQETVTAPPGPTVVGVTKIDGLPVVPAGDGGPETTTTELHEADRCKASTALHVSDVEPTGKSDPDAGEQVVVTGGRPPTTTGANLTITGLPSSDEAVGAVQLIDGAFVAVIGVGPDTSADGRLS